MVSAVNTVAFTGLSAEKVEVQTHIGAGLPSFSIVGLANKSIGESRERIRAAFISMGLSLPAKRITVNLAPAGLNKEGSHYDLPIAVGLLLEMQIIDPEELQNYVVLGELSLDSSVNSVNGVLPAAIWSNSNNQGLICPYDNMSEASWSGNDSVFAVKNIFELVNHFTGKSTLPKISIKKDFKSLASYPDFNDIKGQRIAKRALEIAAAGGHNVLMIGPPGSGKSMLAKRMPSIIPQMTKEEILDVSIIASLAGNLEEGLILDRPFRAPHCSASLAAMIGGGKFAKPGEITLAHLGLLFLDELPEFQKNVLEALRQPLEDKIVTISRVNQHLSYPADFQLIAAMNPCKCGYFGYDGMQCSRIPKCMEDYKGRISGPLFDRFDIQVQVLEFNGCNDNYIESSKDILSRVEVAIKIQKDRYRHYKIRNNASLDGKLLEKFAFLDNPSEEVFKNAINKFKFSMRGRAKIMKVSRTIADLDGSDDIKIDHLKEALSYRSSRI